MGFAVSKFAATIYRVLPLPKATLKKDPGEEILRVLALLEQGERDDHKAAIALERGKSLPAPTKAQLEMRRQSFTNLLAKFMVANKSKAAHEASQPEAGQSRLDPKKLYRLWTTTDRNSVECAICLEMTESTSSLDGPCGHFICRRCVIAMAEVASNNEELFPLQCCQKPLSTDVVLSYLPGPLRTSFSSKCAEAATPPVSRIYCPNKRCSIFIGRQPSSEATTVSCPECSTDVCSQCKSRAHPKESCDENEGREVRALAKEKGWKTCPGCKMIVERRDGCFHMRCRCRQEFCYGCGQKPRGCRCGRYWG